MKMRKTIPLAVSLAGLLMVVGCSSSPTGPSTFIKGVGLDGVIYNATVCIDVNNNDKCDIPEEPHTKTDVFGKFTLDSTGVTGKLILTEGTDMGTGLPFTGSLKAPAGSKVVTPLTSAVQALVKSGRSPEEAEKTIKTALNLPENVALTEYDPFEEIDSDDTDTQKSAQKVLAATAQLQTIVHAVSATVAGADETVSIADAMSHAMVSIASSLEVAVTLAEAKTTDSEKPVEIIIDASMVAKATKAAANELYKAVENETVEAKTKRLSALISVKSVAESVAVEAIAVAENTKEAVEAIDLSADGEAKNIELAFNGGMIVTNKTLEAKVEEKSEKAVKEAVKLDVTIIENIVKAQEVQEKAEAKVDAEELKVAKAMVVAKKAEEAASQDGATKEDIVAAKTAAKELATAQEEKAGVEIAVAVAAKAAAVLEEDVTAEATVKLETAKLAEEKAIATEDLAKLEVAAAEEAEKVAEAAENVEDAKDAVKASDEKAETKIKAAEAAAEKAEAAAAAAAEKAAAAAEAEAEAAAKEAEAEAEAAAEKAAAAEKVANDCYKAGGIMENETCVLPGVTGATGAGTES